MLISTINIEDDTMMHIQNKTYNLEEGIIMPNIWARIVIGVLIVTLALSIFVFVANIVVTYGIEAGVTLGRKIGGQDLQPAEYKLQKADVQLQ